MLRICSHIESIKSIDQSTKPQTRHEAAIDQLINKKRHHLNLYKEHLSDIPDITFNQDDNIVYNGAWITTAVIGKSHNITK